jgi:hypothetical protein
MQSFYLGKEKGLITDDKKGKKGLRKSGKVERFQHNRVNLLQATLCEFN